MSSILSSAASVPLPSQPSSSSSSSSPSTPLVIHVCRGKFMVWQPDVCRALAIEWRMLGEWGPPRQRQQSCSASATSAPTDFVVESLPMYLMPCQVLMLLHHASAAKLLRIIDASTLSTVRQAAGEDGAQQSLTQRLARFEHVVQQQAREAAIKRKKFGVADAQDEAMEQEEKQEETAKRQKTDQVTAATTGNVELNGSDGAAVVPSAAPATTAAASSASSTTEVFVSSLPAASTYHLAISAYPAPADSVLHQHSGHPVALSLPLMHPPSTPPLLVSTKLNQLELRTKITHRSQTAGVTEWTEMQRLVYDGVCEAIGLKLHDDACPSASAASSSRQSSWPAATSFASSSRFAFFLSLYASFRHLWSEGFYLLPGLHFGADLVAYEDLPSKVHSSYLIKIMGSKNERGEEVVEDDKKDQQSTDSNISDLLPPSGAPIRLSAVLMCNLSRMASGINKAVMLVQPRTNSKLKCKTSTASCTCISTFYSHVMFYHRARMECSTFHWNLTPTLANAPFDQQHMKRTILDTEEGSE